MSNVKARTIAFTAVIAAIILGGVIALIAVLTNGSPAPATPSGELTSHGYNVAADVTGSNLANLGVTGAEAKYLSEIAIGFKGKTEAVAVELTPAGLTAVTATVNLPDGGSTTNGGLQITRYGSVLLLQGNLSGDVGSIVP